MTKQFYRRGSSDKRQLAAKHHDDLIGGDGTEELDLEVAAGHSRRGIGGRGARIPSSSGGRRRECSCVSKRCREITGVVSEKRRLQRSTWHADFRDKTSITLCHKFRPIFLVSKKLYLRLHGALVKAEPLLGQRANPINPQYRTKTSLLRSCYGSRD